MPTTAAIRKRDAELRSWSRRAPRSPRCPTNDQPAENAVEPTNETASTGRSARSTSSPQTRRKSRAKSLTLRGYRRGSGRLARPARRRTPPASSRSACWISAAGRSRRASMRDTICAEVRGRRGPRRRAPRVSAGAGTSGRRAGCSIRSTKPSSTFRLAAEEDGAQREAELARELGRRHGLARRRPSRRTRSPRRAMPDPSTARSTIWPDLWYGGVEVEEQARAARRDGHSVTALDGYHNVVVDTAILHVSTLLTLLLVTVAAAVPGRPRRHASPCSRAAVRRARRCANGHLVVTDLPQDAVSSSTRRTGRAASSAASARRASSSG